MNKKIVLTSLFISLIFSTLLIYSSYAQQLPICVAPQQYLYWQSGQHRAGYVPFASTSINFLMRSPIYISGNNVGIGTTSPQAKLHVAGGILSTGNYFFQTGSDQWRGAIYAKGSTTTIIASFIPQGLVIYRYQNSPWQYLGRGDIYVANVLASGRIGIGTNNPQAKLHINAGMDGNIRIDSGDNNILYIGHDRDVGDWIQFRPENASGLAFLKGPDSPAMVIKNDGNVGIGTTNPQAKLHVIGNILSSDTVTANRFCIGTSCINQWPSQIAQYWLLSGNNLYASSTQWNVGIGTTNPQVYKLDIVNTNVNNEGALRAITNVNKTGWIYGVIGSALNTNRYRYSYSIGVYGWASSTNTSYGVYGAGYGRSGTGVRAWGQKYNIYAANPNAVNVFQGNVGIGTAEPLGRLSIEGGKILHYADERNYVARANRLLQIGGGASAGAVVQNVGWPSYRSLFAHNVYITETNPQSIEKIRPDLRAYGLQMGHHISKIEFFKLTGATSPFDYVSLMTILDNGNVGIGTNNPQAKLEVAGAIRLTPSSQPSNATSGMMYFDQSSGVFKCYQKDERGNYGWVNCGGGTQPPSGVATLTVPVQIYDSTGQRLVLEINEEY